MTIISDFVFIAKLLLFGAAMTVGLFWMAGAKQKDKSRKTRRW